MSRTAHRSNPLFLGALAFVSVLVSHHVAYYLAVADPHYRDALLHSTGHRYFVYLAGALLGILAAAAATWVRSDVEAKETRPEGFRYAFPRLLLLQTGGFLCLEATERLLFGGGISQLLFEAPVVIGLVLQILVAIVGGLSLVLAARVVDRLLQRGRRSRRGGDEAATDPPWQHVLPLRSAFFSGGAAPRAPPLLRT